MHNDHATPAPTGETTPPEVWTEERIRALGAITDLPTAGRIFGLGRSLAYELAKHDQFPARCYGSAAAIAYPSPASSQPSASPPPAT